MHQANPKLSIAITTLNRDSYVNSTLGYLCDETTDLRSSGDVEIIAIDNGSSDNTYDYLMEYNNRANVSICKNDRSIDVSKNIYNLIEKCSGTYFWCFGDDDLVPVGAIEDIVQLLAVLSPNHVLLNREDFFSVGEVNLNKSEISVTNYEFSTVSSRFAEYDRLFGFITSNIYLRKGAAKSFAERSNYLNNNYTNKYASWQAARKGVSVFNGPYAYKRCSLGHGSHFHSDLSSKVKTFVFDEVKIALALKQEDSVLGDLALRKCLFNYRHMVKFKISGANLTNVIRDLGDLGVPRRYLRVLQVVSMTPTFILRCLIFVKARLRKMKGLR